MATLLRKVWGSVSNRTSSPFQTASSSSSIAATLLDSSSLGVLFDSIPLDILLQILRLVGPKDAIKLSYVSRAWRLLVSDNRLWIYFLQNHQHNGDHWDSVFFAEMNLRVGYPLQPFPSHAGELSFVRIYGQRAQVPGSVIIDVKLWAVLDLSSSFLLLLVTMAVPAIASLVGASMLVHLGSRLLFWNSGTSNLHCILDLDIFLPRFIAGCQVRPSTQPIVLSIPLCHYDDTDSAKASRRQLRDAIHTVLFDMNVPAVCAVSQATLALFAARRTSGIVVNIGFQVTSVVPILNGKVMHKVGFEVIGLGALKLTGYLRELLQQNNVNFESLYTVRTLKENLCYVATDYKTELSKILEHHWRFQLWAGLLCQRNAFKLERSYSSPVLQECKRAMGLHQAVALCMDHCHAAELTGDDAWFKTIVLSGGTGCLPGLAERLENELYEILSPSVANGIKVIPPPHGVDTAWFGAKFISNMQVTDMSSRCMFILESSLMHSEVLGYGLKWHRLFRAASFSVKHIPRLVVHNKKAVPT
ncbi:Actin-related protein 8 [Hibiscus syriacus]|uniref:Actin-related protein 8 n=1 Tax=Hibiscus syriacus TaxID=106335 RepID=A0A6A3AIV4_HIBSY|nr:Actin-related protein 8 [Hibiscus syriacus]